MKALREYVYSEVFYSECFTNKYTFSPFFEEVPFPVKVFLTNVYEATSELGGWVAQLQGAVFAVSSMKMVPLEEKMQVALQGDNI